MMCGKRHSTFDFFSCFQASSQLEDKYDDDGYEDKDEDGDEKE